ncbi:MAG TPA: metal transporter [Burkholderiales bacterium]|nr:metal transporter [Burkholderiales bacterium]
MKTVFGIRLMIIFVLLAGIVALLVYAAPHFWHGDAATKTIAESGENAGVKPGRADPKATPSDQTGGPRRAAAATGGFTSVKLSAAMQAQSGVSSEELRAANYQPEAVAYGTVLDLQSLTELRTRFNAALAEAEIAHSAMNVSEQEYERVKALYQDNQNTSLKALQKAEQAFLSDKARFEAATSAIQDIKGSARQQFGDVLAGWALAGGSAEFQKFLKREEIIIRVTLSPGLRIAAPSRVQVVANNNPPVVANLVSASPQSDPAILGTAYFYRAAAVLAAGTRVTAYFPTSGQLMKGVFIPGNAVVWFAGQAWSYVQLDPERFERRSVSEDYAHGGGFFVTQGFKPGDRVVVKGVQLLLSEELRSEIQTGDNGDQG